MTAPTRTVSAVAGRSICLYLCAEKAHGTDAELLTELVSTFDVELFLTGREAAYLLDEPALVMQGAGFAAGIHACETLLWAIGRLDVLTPVGQEPDFGEVAAPLLTRGSWQSVAEGTSFRDPQQLHDAQDAVRAAEPGPVAGSRSAAFRWLVDEEKRGWDTFAGRALESGL